MNFLYSNGTVTANTSKTLSSAQNYESTAIGSLARDSDSEHSNDEDDEFFDCQGMHLVLYLLKVRC